MDEKARIEIENKNTHGPCVLLNDFTSVLSSFQMALICTLVIIYVLTLEAPSLSFSRTRNLLLRGNRRVACEMYLFSVEPVLSFRFTFPHVSCCKNCTKTCTCRTRRKIIIVCELNPSKKRKKKKRKEATRKKIIRVFLVTCMNNKNKKKKRKLKSKPAAC